MNQPENDPTIDVTEGTSSLDSPGVSRRSFLGGVGTTAAVMAVGGAALQPTLGGVAEAAEIGPLGNNQRRNEAAKLRKDAAQFWKQAGFPNHPCNGDETLYPNKIGSYSKGLPHNAFGEVNANAYQSLFDALSSGDPADFEDVILGGTGAGPVGKLVNPQCGLAFDLEGSDAHQHAIPPAPALASAEEAAEEIELYWMALLRDVSFNDYATHPLAQDAILELDSLPASAFKGPRIGGQVTAQTLFRDIGPGMTSGPYLSQFFLLPTPFGSEFVDRRSRVFAPGTNFLTQASTWVNVQNGNVPIESAVFDSQRRYLRNGRDMSRWVNIDVLFQGYFNACLTLLTPPNNDDPFSGGIGCPLNPGNPYNSSATQFGFGTFGPPGIKALLCEVASRALKAVWFQKWFVHRRLRPEAYGGLVHFQKASNRYPGVLHPSVLNSEAVDRVHTQYGTYFLPMAFPEGSPTHPAYGAGHATVAGACVTLLKALFNENFVIPNPVVAASDGLSTVAYGGPALTVRGELNKLASNVATGRNIAGVHWRTDAFWSLRLGQEIAVDLLRDQRSGYNEIFNGYTFTGFDGETITV